MIDRNHHSCRNQDSGKRTCQTDKVFFIDNANLNVKTREAESERDNAPQKTDREKNPGMLDLDAYPLLDLAAPPRPPPQAGAAASV